MSNHPSTINEHTEIKLNYTRLNFSHQRDGHRLKMLVRDNMIDGKLINIITNYFFWKAFLDTGSPKV